MQNDLFRRRQRNHKKIQPYANSVQAMPRKAGVIEQRRRAEVISDIKATLEPVKNVMCIFSRRPVKPG